ncbi:MAG: hypothetical protein HFE54_02260 [Turicibacter sp.]|uniref:hypothetical protein n=1 Tax=unclassified Turicibacter TaxID=2638206 RepID=UPI00137B7347|nr:hypothetical protein [Turicibacter sp. TS3]MCI8701670.1 hypothetical protein [Turicibacter sp.]MCI9350746.1 hypothetical protein [Turicibacter sp.]NCE77637.1 hypothetical protein [Turicibacter sp. TS3]
MEYLTYVTWDFPLLMSQIMGYGLIILVCVGIYQFMKGLLQKLDTIIHRLDVIEAKLESKNKD